MSAPSFRRSSRRGTIQIQISSGGGRNVSSWQSVPPTVVTIRSYYKLIESRVIGDPLAPHVRHCLDEVNIKLDQVYCAWLIKWVVKREIIQLAELCLSRWWIKSGTWWYWISIWRYWLVLGQYKLELLGFRWYRVSKGLVCLYILEKVEIWSCVTDASHTDRHQNIGLLSLSPV